VIGAVGKLLGVRIAELGLYGRLANGNQSGIGDDAELLHLGGQQDAGGRQQQRINVFQRVSRVEALKVHCGRGNDLLAQL